MNMNEKKAMLDRFARDMSGVVIKYLCFGIHGSEPELCAKCTVKKQCKQATPKGVKR